MRSILLGLGNVGLNYDYNLKRVIYTHAEALLKNRKLNFFCAIDKSMQQRKKFKKKYNIPTKTDIDDINLNDKIKLAIISTSTNSHLEILKKLVKFRNIKLVLIEKPCGKNFGELKSIYKICKKHNIMIYINYNRLYDYNYKKFSYYFSKLKDFKGVAYYSRGLRNNCSHILSLLSSLNLKNIKIKILKYGKNPDFRITFSKGELYFLNSSRKNISNNEIEIMDKNYKIMSKDELNTFEIFKIKKEKLINNNFKYINLDTVKFDIIKPQFNVLKKVILKNKNYNNFIKEVSYDVSKILDKIIIKASINGIK